MNILRSTWRDQGEIEPSHIRAKVPNWCIIPDNRVWSQYRLILKCLNRIFARNAPVINLVKLNTGQTIYSLAWMLCVSESNIVKLSLEQGSTSLLTYFKARHCCNRSNTWQLGAWATVYREYELRRYAVCRLWQVFMGWFGVCCSVFELVMTQRSSMESQRSALHHRHALKRYNYVE